MLTKEIDRILSFTDSMSSVFAVLTGVLVLLIFLYFFWGTVEYIRKEEGFEEIKKKLLWGIIGITTIVSIWGIVYFLQETFFGSGFNDDGVIEYIETIAL